jgi:hypothetical protein
MPNHSTHFCMMKEASKSINDDKEKDDCDSNGKPD